MHLLLGVDGGGTKTRATLAHVSGEPGEVIACGVSGPSNVVTDGFATATENIHAAIRAAFEQIDIAPATVASACFAIAGCNRESVRDCLRTWIEDTKIAARYALVNDAEPLLFAVSPSGQGVAIVSGTGSLAYGRNSAGVTARAGGWGPLISDEGSGYSIAMEGLKAVMRTFDGRSPSTKLTELVRCELSLNSIAELPRAFNQLNRSDVARLASCVSVAADNDDGVASQILESAGFELASLANCVIQKLAFDECNVAVHGSVLLNSRRVYRSLESNLESTGEIPIRLTRIVDSRDGLLTIAKQALTQ